MKTYQAAVTRDGKWWMVAIPELNGLTQARRLSEAGDMAREWIAAELGDDPDSFEVSVHVTAIDDIDISQRMAEIRAERERAAELERQAAEQAAELAKALAARNVPVRDIGAAMGISFQRAHQLVNA